MKEQSCSGVNFKADLDDEEQTAKILIPGKVEIVLKFSYDELCAFTNFLEKVCNQLPSEKNGFLVCDLTR